MRHELIVSRHQLGRGALKGSPMRYGTTARCTCEEWETKSQQPPSAGGNAWAKRVHRLHLKETSTDGDIDILLRLIKQEQDRLTEAIDFKATSFIKSHFYRILAWSEELVADLKKQQDALGGAEVQEPEGR